MSTRVYRRVLLQDLPQLEAEGWKPANVSGSTVGADPFSAGTGASVLVYRDDPVLVYETHLLDISDLGGDERLVVLEIVERIRHGQRLYGSLDIMRNPKDWAHEASEEFLDGAIYMAMESIRRARQRR